MNTYVFDCICQNSKRLSFVVCKNAMCMYSLMLFLLNSNEHWAWALSSEQWYDGHSNFIRNTFDMFKLVLLLNFHDNFLYSSLFKIKNKFVSSFRLSMRSQFIRTNRTAQKHCSTLHFQPISNSKQLYNLLSSSTMLLSNCPISKYNVFHLFSTVFSMD